MLMQWYKACHHLKSAATLLLSRDLQQVLPVALRIAQSPLSACCTTTDLSYIRRPGTIMLCLIVAVRAQCC